MTGTTPQTLRLHLLNAAPDEGAVVGIFYERPWRLDVHTKHKYIMPTNGYMENDQMLLRDFVSREYVPDPSIDESGANFFDDNYNLLWVLVKGEAPVFIKTSSLVILQFDLPGVTADEFFDTENIRRNLALFLNIPAEKIVIAKAVSENSGTRKRRASDCLSLIVSIADQPSNSTDTNSTSDSNDASDMVFERIVTGFQLGNLTDVLNITIGNLEITAPPPAPGSDQWEVLVEEDGESTSVVIVKPDRLVIIDQPSDEPEEQMEFFQQPTLRVADTDVSMSAEFSYVACDNIYC